MKEAARNFMIIAGILWSLIWLVLWFFGIGKGMIYLFYEIPGIILIIIGVYNWGSGMNMENKQKYPIENQDISFMRD